MSVKKLAAGVLAAVLGAAFIYAAAFAADTVPGSEGDPVVTRSYVDKRIGEVMRVVEGSGNVSDALASGDLTAQIESVVRQQVAKAQGATFAPVSIEMGKIIYGGEGTEMIMRSGAGHIVTSTDTVVNATTGIDLKNGAPVPRGNLLIFPRDDGRGIKAANNCWFLVKGAYTIK